MNFIIPFIGTYDLGKGLSSLTGVAKGSIFLNYELQDSDVARGQIVNAALTKIESAEKLMEALSIDVSVSASFGLFSAEGKFGFASETNINSYSIYYVYKVRVQNAIKRIKNLVYDPFAINLLQNGNTDRFNRMYGDSYIEGIITGGEFYAIYELQCSDESSRQKISAELDASYGGLAGGVDLHAKFSSAIESASKKSTLRVRVFQTGGRGENANLVFEPGEILLRAQKFPSIVAGDGAVPFEVIRGSYETLPLPEGPNYIQLEAKRELLSTYSKDILDLRKIQNNLKYMLISPWEFELDSKDLADDDIRLISDVLQNLNAYIESYRNHAARCAETMQLCSEFGQTFARPARLPKRKNHLKFVVLFTGKDYAGEAYYIEKGSYKDYDQLGLGNDTISSIKLPTGYVAYLYQHIDFKGKNYPLTTSASDLSRNNDFDDMISSMIIFEENDENQPGSINNPYPTAAAPDDTPARRVNQFRMLDRSYLHRIRL